MTASDRGIDLVAEDFRASVDELWDSKDMKNLVAIFLATALLSGCGGGAPAQTPIISQEASTRIFTTGVKIQYTLQKLPGT